MLLCFLLLSFTVSLFSYHISFALSHCFSLTYQSSFSYCSCLLSSTFSVDYFTVLLTFHNLLFMSVEIFFSYRMLIVFFVFFSRFIAMDHLFYNGVGFDSYLMCYIMSRVDPKCCVQQIVCSRNWYDIMIMISHFFSKRNTTTIN